MPVGVFTAALQELTPREQRDADPDLAIEEWLDYATTLEVDCIELSAALHPSVADVPAEALLDPVANTLDLRRAVRPSASEASPSCNRRHRSAHRRHRLRRRHAARRPGDPSKEARVLRPRHARRGLASRRRCLRLRGDRGWPVGGNERRLHSFGAAAVGFARRFGSAAGVGLKCSALLIPPGQVRPSEAIWEPGFLGDPAASGRSGDPRPLASVGGRPERATR